jgi:hypothetical protein
MGRHEPRFRTARRNLPKLSFREQLVGIGLVCAVDFALLGVAYAIGWQWFLDYGRATLIVPTLVVFGLWYWWRTREES